MENIVHDHTATVTLRCSLDPIRVISKSPYLAAHFQPLFHHHCPTCSCQRHRPQAPHRLHDLPTQKTSNVSSLVTEWLSKPCSPSVLYV